jgi:hypothetical protein
MTVLQLLLDYYKHTCKQIEKHFPVGEQVHVLPADTRFQGSDDSVGGAQDGVVDQFLKKI